MTGMRERGRRVRGERERGWVGVQDGGGKMTVTRGI